MKTDHTIAYTKGEFVVLGDLEDINSGGKLINQGISLMKYVKRKGSCSKKTTYYLKKTNNYANVYLDEFNDQIVEIIQVKQ